MALAFGSRRADLFNRMKRATARLRGKRREAVKSRWWAWADRQQS